MRRLDAPLAARVAYRSGQKITCERTGEVFDFSRKTDVMNPFDQVYLPGGKREDRETFWARVDVHDRKAAAIPAREAVIALPYLLSDNQRAALITEFAQEVVKKYGVGVDVFLHRPEAFSDDYLNENKDQFFIKDKWRGGEKNNGNYHAHLLLTTSKVDAETGALSRNVRELDPIHCRRNKLQNTAEWARPLWASLVNKHLAVAGIQHTVEHASFEKRGVEKVPTKHQGPAGRIKRTGRQSNRGDFVAEHNSQAARINRRIGRLKLLTQRLQTLLEERTEEALNRWVPYKNLVSLVEQLEQRKATANMWLDWRKITAAQNITVAAILIHRLLAWLGLGGLPDVVAQVAKVHDSASKLDRTATTYEKQLARLDRLAEKALPSIEQRREHAQAEISKKLEQLAHSASLDRRPETDLAEKQDLVNQVDVILATARQLLSTKTVEIEAVPTWAYTKTPAEIRARINLLKQQAPDIVVQQKTATVNEQGQAVFDRVQQLQTQLDSLAKKLADPAEMNRLWSLQKKKEIEQAKASLTVQIAEQKQMLAALRRTYAELHAHVKREAQHKWKAEVQPQLEELQKWLPKAEALAHRKTKLEEARRAEAQAKVAAALQAQRTRFLMQTIKAPSVRGKGSFARMINPHQVASARPRTQQPGVKNDARISTRTTKTAHTKPRGA
ncbi:hypothetical protein CJO09_00960 [Neopusillimonas maritima]|jgi:hypothetical protein|uniref:MobA/MobL protein domain-containing protein n=2 Tax=Neopusillimonas maritima TaxID=2026239 RepID=A0ABX9MZ61_9BURK|nr:hypothetical protein CJO09_00960 [Neopusillimonas maritima]